jgi:hypothetical protein
MDNEKQEQPQPKQTSVKDQVSVLIKAYELAGNATAVRTVVKELSRETIIYFDDGNSTTTNPTLAHYLAIAEKKFVEANSPLIIEDARFMLEKELDAIRGMVNG